MLGVNPPSRFGQFQTDNGEVLSFEEKPAFSDEWINGGYFFFRREFLQYLSRDEACILEKTPLIAWPTTASSRSTSTAGSGPAWTPSATWTSST